MRSDEEGISKIFLKQREVCITKRPAIVSTVLGSCISVVMFDSSSGVGGICHALLPRCPERKGCGEGCPERFRYVDCAVEWMFREFSSYRACGPKLEVKLFGGGSIIEADHASVGQQNIWTAERILEKQGIKPIRADVGGPVGRKVVFYTHTGDVYVKRFSRKLFLQAGRAGRPSGKAL